VADSAAPVLESATYSVNSGAHPACDTLVVTFSEPVNTIQASSQFLLSGKSGQSYTFNLSTVASAGKTDTFCVSSASASNVPQNGDMMWIAPNNSVSDAGGVFQNNANNRKVQLNVIRPAVKWTAWAVSISCNPFTVNSSAGNGACPSTIITIKPVDASLAIPNVHKLQLQIFDVLGNCIFDNSLASLDADLNPKNFTWDGRNKSGRWVGSGVYRAIITVIDETGTSSKSISIGVKR
jgi:hypothetical protein